MMAKMNRSAVRLFEIARKFVAGVVVLSPERWWRPPGNTQLKSQSFTALARRANRNSAGRPVSLGEAVSFQQMKLTGNSGYSILIAYD